ncbi:LacI family DNA-binding transcriptional regulator [Shimazuella kribbensis]|uniref:LacI family DNA-binding transcriptional regulator n=1 Tax=Shimazuella kribbensis TaxID=139808 RepID=UPI00040AF18A|nr:LacI family DNA-binding transcriptional regulator [Shimazuella kribbensis]
MSLTIKDIAKMAGVSITSVSRVLNNKTEGISESTRQRVLKIIEQHNYRPNAIARSMITKNTKTIGLIIPDIRNPFFSDLARGIEDVASESKYSILLCNTDSTLGKIIDYLWLLKEKNVDGMIFACSDPTLNREVHTFVKQNNIPVVIVDRGLEDQMYSGVFIDNEKAAYMATKHLLELSHTRIGCISGPSFIKNSNERLEGYFKAHQEFGVPTDKSLIRVGEYVMEGGYQAAKELLEQTDVTALFAFNDLMAFGVYQAAEELGLKIPDDISVVGFDNLKYNLLLHPKLTTMEQPIYEIGEVATKLLLEQIEEGKSDQIKSVFLDTKLIVRESTKKR